MQHMLTRIIADGAVIPVVVLGAWALLTLVRGNRYQAYARILLAGLTAYMAAKFIGAVFQPETMRPFEKLGVEAGAAYLNNPGFPSDHVLFCVAIVLAVWFETKNRKVTLILAGLTALVAIGRIVALVHTPLDVAGGIVIACAGIPWYLQRPKISPGTRQKTKTTVK